MRSLLATRRRPCFRPVSLLLILLFIVSPIAAQQPAARPPATPAPARAADPTFETLLANDAYKLYGEVRNVGQLLSTGGAGEIVEPIIKLADPGKEFKSIVSFLKKNSEALASARLQFASWPARTDVPTFFVAIEFPTNEDAAKFAPKLQTFLPTVLPPVAPSPEPAPVAAPTPGGASSQSPPPKAAQRTNQGAAETADQFLITRTGNLVCITDKSFKFEKLHPAGSKPLFQDASFRAVHDKFATEPVFVFINVALEDKTKPQRSPGPVISDQQAAGKVIDTAAAKVIDTGDSAADAVTQTASPTPVPDVLVTTPVNVPTVSEPSPTPTPTKERQAQAIATSQIGHMLDSVGFGEPQFPEAVGVALALDGNEYVLRAMLVDKPEAKLLPIPFVPQLIAGPAYNAGAASVLPDDTEMFVSASIDLTQSYEGMKKQAEIRAKEEAGASRFVKDGVVIWDRPESEPQPDAFAQFEKKAGFKIKDDLLPALGSEIALAGSVKTLQGMGGFMAGPPPPTPSPDPNDPKQKNASVMPTLLIGVKDREAVRKLMPKVLEGFGLGEANLLAQKERHGDAEIVNYAGMFAYGFVGDFLVISDTAGVRQVVEASENNQTLSSNTVYRNSRHWQPSRTLGQVYVSPVLMEGYHEQIRKGAASLEPAMRDFLLGLNPKTEAITYALSNDGLGTNHELHLPKNLILTMVAGISSAVNNPPPEMNEGIAMGALHIIANSEAQYKATAKDRSYLSLQELVDKKFFPMEDFDKYGYKFEVTVIGDQFEAVAMPKEYGKTGKRSFYIDKSGVLRGDDHGGGPATVADKALEP